MRSKMKRGLLGTALVAVLTFMMSFTAFADEGGVVVDENTFPDAKFREYVLKNIDKDRNQELSEAEISVVKSIDMTRKGVSTMKGVEIFTGLTSLKCGNNLLTELDVSSLKELETLYCNYNQLTELDVSGFTKLTYLDCGANQLQSLNVTGCTGLGTIYLGTNQIIDLDASGLTSLKTFRCNNNPFHSLNISGCSKLDYLYIDKSTFVELYASDCEALTSLKLSNKGLKNLDVSGCLGLTSLDCSNNELQSLNIGGCSKLANLDCHSNQLTSVDITGINKLINAYSESTSTEPGKYVYGANKLQVDKSVEIITDHTHIHDWDNGRITVQPTCTSKGTKVYTCEICGQNKKEILNMTDHTIVIDKAVEPTCEHTGLTAGSHCSKCDTIIEEQTIVKALGHKIVKIPGVAATYTKTGLTEGKKCSKCGVILVKQTVIPKLVKNGWIKENGKWYFYSNGKKSTGWKKINGNWYYLPGGAMQTGWKQISKNWYYFGTDGIMRTGWETIYGKKYYFGTDGIMRTGWEKVGNKWYYFSTSGIVQTDWKQISGKWYYFGANGIMQTGWKKIGTKWYYFNSSGIMQTGWKQIGKWYYFGNDGAMRIKWQKINGVWYYFGEDGIMQTGWQVIGGKQYYFKNGAMAVGWLKSGSDWYYFNANGIMQTGVLTISGKKYVFGKDGVLLQEEPGENRLKVAGNQLALDSESEILSYTPAGMKKKRILATEYKKEALTPVKALLEGDDKLLKYYDEYYSINQYDNYTRDLDKGIPYETAMNKYYKKIFSELEVVNIRVKFSRRWNPTTEDINTCWDAGVEYWHYIHLVDGKTSRSLISNNIDLTPIAELNGVYVSYFNWSYGDTTRFYNEYGDYIKLTDNGSTYITIIKPKNYTNLYLGVSGGVQKEASVDEKQFYSGKVGYEKTSWYTKAPNNTKWLNLK